MPEYLSKEEVKQWRSSLEKITLEEYAARLGKVIEEEKQTNDLIDIVFKESSTITKNDGFGISKGEKISSIAQKAFEREKEISSSLSSVLNKKEINNDKKVKKIEKTEKTDENINTTIKAQPSTLREEVQVTFSKSLTEREQLVFDYFAQNTNQIVYAKDLAKLLSLPRDYVYKYIKNLRAKIEGDKLQNSENGGYIFLT